MFNIAQFQNNVIKHNDVTLELCFYFDTILSVYEIQAEPDLNEIEKINLMFLLLVKNAQSYEDIFTFEDITEILINIMNMLTEDIEVDKDRQETVNIAYDFNIDSERIFASFLQDYGINLIQEQGKMLWNEFIALLNNLSKDTPFMQAVYYRTVELPQGKEYDDIRKDIKAKRKIYQLPIAVELEKQAMVDKLMQEVVEM